MLTNHLLLVRRKLPVHLASSRDHAVSVIEFLGVIESFFEFGLVLLLLLEHGLRELLLNAG